MVSPRVVWLPAVATIMSYPMVGAVARLFRYLQSRVLLLLECLVHNRPVVVRQRAIDLRKFKPACVWLHLIYGNNGEVKQTIFVWPTLVSSCALHVGQQTWQPRKKELRRKADTMVGAIG